MDALKNESAAISPNGGAVATDDQTTLKLHLTRREFLNTIAIAGAAVATSFDALSQHPAVRGQKIKLGLDNFSVRAMAWKAPALIDYAASLNTDSLFITDFDAFENFEDKYL